MKRMNGEKPIVSAVIRRTGRPLKLFLASLVVRITTGAVQRSYLRVLNSIIPAPLH
jgi:hypothetical protein